MEVIEHLDLDRLPALEHAVFGAAATTTVVVSTPNAEYNVRPGHLTWGDPAAARHLRRGVRSLGREGFRKVHVLNGTEEIEHAVINYEKQYNDRREDIGPFDVIGDVHGCGGDSVVG